jgi:hypothetical protein
VERPSTLVSFPPTRFFKILLVFIMDLNGRLPVVEVAEGEEAVEEEVGEAVVEEVEAGEGGDRYCDPKKCFANS